jgi:hypothetical protein
MVESRRLALHGMLQPTNQPAADATHRFSSLAMFICTSSASRAEVKRSGSMPGGGGGGGWNCVVRMCVGGVRGACRLRVLVVCVVHVDCACVMCVAMCVM